MPLDDLAHATRSLLRLLDLNVRRLEGLPPGTTELVVTPDPPETITTDNTISLHLYHVSEDPHYRNLPGPDLDPPNVASNPMGLTLYYILTAHHGDAPEMENRLIPTRLMGHALKTLHDHPVITEHTRAGDPPELVWPEDPNEPLSALRGNGNRIQTILRPVSPEDAMAFWGSEEHRTTRLSAYYEARVVFLQPERPRRVPGTVLEVGSFVFQLGAPTLDSSRSHLLFTVPGPGGGPRTSRVSPARVALNDQPGPPPEHNRMELLGTNLAAGVSRELLLSAPHWDDELAVDPSLPQNAAWAVTFDTARIDVTLAPQLRAEGADQPVLPGIYTARVRAVAAEQVLGGELRQLPVSSNAAAFAVTPRLAGVQQPDVDDAALIRVEVGGEFSLVDPLLDEADAIQVIVDGLPYERVADPPGGPQQFAVRDDGGIPNAVRLNPHAGLGDTGLHPFRLIVNGAESAPFWIDVP